MKIRLLKNDLEKFQQMQKKRMFSSDNYCCFFPFRQRSSTSIITSDVNEAYEEIVFCMENALRCDAAEITLSGEIIASKPVEASIQASLLNFIKTIDLFIILKKNLMAIKCYLYPFCTTSSLFCIPQNENH